jgi:pyroglutamyl-peptidase
MKPILLTGFEPFEGSALNPSEQIVRRLNGSIIAEHVIAGEVLPCEFQRSIRELKRHIKRLSPSLVICLGQAGGRTGITAERVAINIDDARIADNAGVRPIDRPVVRGGPAAYWSTLPIKAIVETLQAKRIQAAVSQTAGTYVCNHVFYGLMHAIHGHPVVRGGFIHVPWLPTQGRPNLSLETMILGIRLAVEVAVTSPKDRKISGGRLD